MRTFGRPSPSAIAAALVVMAYASEAFAGCADVNAGAFDRAAYTPPGSGVLDTGTGFEVGDEITFIVSGLPGNRFQVINGALDTALLDQPLSSSPATVSYVVTGSNSDTTLNTYMLVQALPFEITIAATCIPSGGGGAASSEAAVRGFLASRIDGILINDPSATSLLHRSGNTAPQPLAFAGSARVANTATPFESAMGFGSDRGGETQPGGGILAYDAGDNQGSTSVQFSRTYETNSPWNVWIEGRYAAFDGSSDRSGQVGVLGVGGDYRVAENVILGLLAQFDWARDESGALASRVEGAGWMIGPYMSARIHDGIYLDLRAAWGQSSNDLAVDGTTGAFDTTRWLVKGALSGNWTQGAWRFTPAVELAYISESAGAFTDSADTLVPSEQVSLGRLQFGPEIGYRFGPAAGAFVEPFAAIKGVWDFDNPAGPIVDGYATGRSDFRGRLLGGLNVVTANGLSVRGLASWDGLGAEGHNAYTLQGTVRLPLN